MAYMDDRNAFDRYVDRINNHILPFIDYVELHKSYITDMAYAKGIAEKNLDRGRSFSFRFF